MFNVYGDSFSVNCYKIKLLMSLLSIEHKWVHVDILKGESRTPEFLKMNPTGQIPVLEIEENNHLSESNVVFN